MLGLERVVVPDDAARFWAILVVQNCFMREPTEVRKVFLHVQDIGIGIHPFQRKLILLQQVLE
jgi:hypothetical protein